MKLFLRVTGMAVALLLFVRVAAACASFGLRPLPPAERGAASRLALGIDHGAHTPGDPGQRGRFRLRAVQVYGFKPFGLDEADFAEASILVGVGGRVDLGLCCNMLRVLSYREQTFQLSCTWKVGRLRFKPSVRFGTVGNGGSVVDRAVLPDFLLTARPLSDLVVMFGTHNPFGAGLVRSRERCPTDVSAGLGYRLCSGLNFGAEIVKEGGFPTSVVTGAELSLGGRVLIRTGLRTHPGEFSLGLGLNVKRVTLDTSASLHLDLGVTHEAGITYRRD